jgi:hypothetical protein
MSSGSGWIRDRISSTYTIPFIEKKKKGIYMYWKRERGKEQYPGAMAREKTGIRKVVDWGSGTVVLLRRRKRSEERSAVLLLSSLGLERRRWNKVSTGWMNTQVKEGREEKKSVT